MAYVLIGETRQPVKVTLPSARIEVLVGGDIRLTLPRSLSFALPTSFVTVEADPEAQTLRVSACRADRALRQGRLRPDVMRTVVLRGGNRRIDLPTLPLLRAGEYEADFEGDWAVVVAFGRPVAP